MSEMFEKSIRILELPRVLELLAGHAVSQEGKDKARRLYPALEREDVLRLLEQTDAARNMLGTQGSPNFAGLKSVAEALGRADRNGMLNNRELLDIAGVLRCSRRVKDYFNDQAKEKTAIDYFFQSLHTNRYLEDKITNAILDENEIADTASPELAEIRRHKRVAAAKGRQILQKIISSPGFAKILQEALVTQRDGRFVVPVKAEYRSSMPGLVHDISSSGATVFIEPMSVVQANNELKELEAKEEQEIERILRDLSAKCADSHISIQWDYDMLVQLDVIFAKAQLSYQMNACSPEIRSDGRLRLHKARHPLLDPAKAVPIDLELGESFDTLVITGPNTGGKTVTLKTLGLLTLMTQCGLHIPVSDGSVISVFRRVLADIGDEQSIEQSLSTFSSHMMNIVRIMDEADDESLILFDELGAGTDPIEGAALAIAVIQRIRSMGARVAATTHYAELKTFAMTTAGVENASCEFDVETLRPTYKLLIGIPGKSNAFAISMRLGLDPAVIQQAKEQMNSESIRFEDILSQLEEKRQALEKSQLEVQRMIRSREEDVRKAREYREQMERARDNARTKGEAEAKRIIAAARAAADSTFAELNALKKKQKENDWQAVNESKTGIRRSLNEAEEALRIKQEKEPIPAPSRPIRAGDRVELGGTRTQAEVLEVKGENLILQAGRMKLTVKAKEVRLIEEYEKVQAKEEKKKAMVTTQIRRAAAASNELDIRGMMTDEAEGIVDRFIDSAQMGKLNFVSIIHGKGTGALRKSVHAQLKRHPGVKGFRLGRYGEGEDGVTIVELR